MELASVLVSVLALVVSAWVGYRQWRRDGPLIRCEGVWDFNLTVDGPAETEPFLVIKAINSGRSPVQITGFGVLAGKEDLGEISFWGEYVDIHGPDLPCTVDGGHLAKWAGWFTDPKGRPLRPYVVLATGKKRVAKRTVGPPPTE